MAVGAGTSLNTLRAPPSQGNPKPQVSWTHNGQALDSKRVSVRNGDQDSILFIRSAQRSDSGCYELTVRLETLEARAAINILVIGMAQGRQRASSGAQTPHLLHHSCTHGVRPGECDRGEILGVRVGGPAQPPPSLPLTLVLQRSPTRPAASG